MLSVTPSPNRAFCALPLSSTCEMRACVYKVYFRADWEVM